MKISRNLRVAIFSSNTPRHAYFIRKLAEKFTVVGVVSEEKVSQSPVSSIKEEKDERPSLLAWWGDLKRSAEEFFFGLKAEPLFSSQRHISIGIGSINNPEIRKAVELWEPEVIAVYGTSLLRADLIGTFPGKVINMHLGLSPYYRGSATNLWPLVNEEPEYIGVTVHYIDRGIDTGPIIHQAQPVVALDDDPHRIGARCVLLGTELMAKSLEEFSVRPPEGVVQQEKGRLYQRKDWDISCIQKIKQFVDSGGIEKYAREQEVRKRKIKIIP